LGDLSLTENLFFLGHDLFTGKVRIRRDMLEIGLSGAVLADLLFDGRIALDTGMVRLADRYATGDPVADRVLALILAEPDQHGVRDWVDHLRAEIFVVVAEKLITQRFVAMRETRVMLRKTTLYQPTDLRMASVPRTRVRAAMMGRAQADLPTATLALLAWTIGLDDICEPDLPRRQAAEWVEQASSMLVDPTAGLVAGVDASVAAAIYGAH
jgi:hypothetical protein